MAFSTAFFQMFDMNQFDTDMALELGTVFTFHIPLVS
jgi:hypothetical protein